MSRDGGPRAVWSVTSGEGVSRDIHRPKGADVDAFRAGLEDAWSSVAAFLPKLAGFLLILIVGYFIAKLIEKVIDKVLERVGFDKAVERGGIKKALEGSKFDASSILAKVVFYTIFLFVLQLAFSVFGDNPISDLITGVIAYLPKVFVAILILVLGSAIAAAVKEIVEASIGGLSYGRPLALGASAAILVIAVFAALDQLEIAPTVVNTLFIGMVVLVVGSGIIAIGGGGIKTMQQYWERTSQRLERESDRIQDEAQGATDRIQDRAQERAAQVQGQTPGTPRP
ncbi:MAG: hypothetical protein KY391_03090 [Actinobacteria bacterium]|nr:hypothetical protein [Actinomycetota bacterium]